jgi:hypothetical protein
MVGIALGNFNQDSTAAYFKKQKLPTTSFHGYTFYAFGTGTGATDLFFVFIDASTAAYGHKSILEKMISVRFGDEEGLMRNDKFFSLINEANTGSSVWLVTNPAYTRLAMQQLAPEIEQFPEAAKLVMRMQNSIINIEAGSDLDAKSRRSAVPLMMPTRLDNCFRRASSTSVIKRKKTIQTSLRCSIRFASRREATA